MSEKIGQFFNNQHRLLQDISHDLRTPLARIYISLDIAEKVYGESFLPTKTRMLSELEELKSYTEQLLRAAELENFQLRLQSEKVDLNALLKNIIDKCQFEFNVSKKTIEFSFDSKYEVMGQRSLLNSAFENIIRNALEYTKKNGKVTVDLRRGSGQNCTVSVLDEGPGVAEDQLELLFEAFYRVVDDSNCKRQGWGLGLAIAARAVALHKGSITAKNRPEGGLEIEVKLPHKH